LEGLLSSFKGPSSNQKKKEKNYGVRQPMGRKYQGQSDFLGQKLRNIQALDSPENITFVGNLKLI
jgi:hypothetical protein